MTENTNCMFWLQAVENMLEMKWGLLSCWLAFTVLEDRV